MLKQCQNDDQMQWAMSLGSHCSGYCLGTLSCSHVTAPHLRVPHTISGEDLTTGQGTRMEIQDTRIVITVMVTRATCHIVWCICYQIGWYKTCRYGDSAYITHNIGMQFIHALQKPLKSWPRKLTMLGTMSPKTKTLYRAYHRKYYACRFFIFILFLLKHIYPG